MFGRKHFNVLQAIDAFDCSHDFRELNFQLSEYEPGEGFRKRTYRSYDMTKDGFTFLVMGFTGSAAARFKEAYIAAFNGAL